jgi:hypothetical protein
MIAKMLLAVLVACDPALIALFAPHGPSPGAQLGARQLGTRLGRYEICTSRDPIEGLVPAGTNIEASEPLDVFGAAGTYDRFAVARLYGGRRARVARAWTLEGREFQSRTYISPYPDATLARLIEGTMTITFYVTTHDEATPGRERVTTEFRRRSDR